MRLLRVELDRFRSRRAVALILLAAALVTVLVAATEIWNTRPVSAAELRAAESRAAVDAANPDFTRDLAACEENPQAFLGPEATAAQCESFMTPRAEWYLNRSVLDPRNVLDDSGVALVVIVTALLIICGATFAGADWSSGSVSNQLLFEPRRGRVWLGKALAVLVGGLAAAAVLVVGFWTAMYLVADARGIAVRPAVTHDVLWYGGRGILLAGLGAVGGYALTMLLRSTVATLAVLFVYSVGGEALVLALPLERATQWSLANNVFAWVKDGTRVYDQDIPCTPGLDVCDQSYQLTIGHGAAYLGLLLGVTLLVSLLAFRRRDVP